MPTCSRRPLGDVHGSPERNGDRHRADRLTRSLVFRPVTPMRTVSRFTLLAGAVIFPFLTGCQTGPLASKGGGNYHVTALRPNDPSKVRVLVSLSKQNIYVMES